MLLGKVREAIADYYAKLPNNTFSSMGKSTLYSFTVSFIISASDSSKTISLNRPFIAAGVACLAAGVHACTTPMFNYIFENDQIIWHQEVIRYVVDYTMTGLIMKHVTAYKVNELAFRKLAIFFISSHMLRLVIDVPLYLVEMADQGAAVQAKTWLSRWGFKFKTDINPTYGII